MSASLQPDGPRPTRLLRPWDSPSKNTRVGSHALLQGYLPYPEIEPTSSVSPALQVDSLPVEPLGKLLVSQKVKNLPVMQETQVAGQEDPLKKGMATHSSIIAWRIPWTAEPGGLQSLGSQRVGHD